MRIARLAVVALVEQRQVEVERIGGRRSRRSRAHPSQGAARARLSRSGPRRSRESIWRVAEDQVEGAVVALEETQRVGADGAAALAEAESRPTTLRSAARRRGRRASARGGPARERLDRRARRCRRRGRAPGPRRRRRGSRRAPRGRGRASAGRRRRRGGFKRRPAELAGDDSHAAIVSARSSPKRSADGVEQRSERGLVERAVLLEQRDDAPRARRRAARSRRAAPRPGSAAGRSGGCRGPRPRRAARGRPRRA